jgi:quercetin dioxygenase-like cupin family protein
MPDDVIHPDWRMLVHYTAPGPQPVLLRDDADVRVLIAGLEPGGRIPPHPGPLGVFHFLAGDGVMTVEGEEREVSAGMTAIAPAGAVRGVAATSRLAVLVVRVGAESSH